MTPKPKRKYVSTDTIIDLAEVVLKKEHLYSGKRHLSQNRGLLLVPNLHLCIAFYLWQKWKKILVPKLTLLINAKIIWKYFSRKEDTVLNWCENNYFVQEKFQGMNC